MKLIKAYVRGFGNIVNTKIDFTKNIYEICEDNGYGKSTIAHFIKAMFYGFETTRKNDSNITDRKKFLPFNSSAYGGSLDFEYQGHLYHVDRVFGAKSQKEDLFEYSIDGMPNNVIGYYLGQALFNLDEEAFTKTIFFESGDFDVKPNDKYFRKTAEKIKKEGLNKTRQVKKGDFILSNSMCFGRPYILDIDGCIHDGWLVIQDYQETYDMLFLYYILCSDAVMNQYASMAAGSSVQNLNKEKVANVLLYAPSSLKEQSAIAKVLSSMDEEISFLEAKREKYNAIKQGMMQQLLTGKIRLVETAVKPNATSANVHFRRSVWAAEIAERLYEEPTFGHVKMEKILFLTERLCHIDIGSHYHRDAAGPYDNNALRSIDSQLKKQKWFEVQRTEKGYRYVPMRNCGIHKTYFKRYYSGIVPMFDKIINTFKTQNTERCEIVATLYSAWEDLLHSNKSFTDADIVNEVLNNWHESKKRISQDRWLKAIQWMRDNGFAPDMSVYMK